MQPAHSTPGGPATRPTRTRRNLSTRTDRHGACATLGLAGVLLASTLSAQLQPSEGQRWHQGSPGVRGGLESDGFGYATATGDFNGDGRPDMVVGSPYETVNGVEGVGAIHVFFGTDAGFNVHDPDDIVLSQATPGIPSLPEPLDFWGAPLAVGDFDGNGLDDIAVAAPREDIGSGGSKKTDAGAVTILFTTAAGGIGARVQTLHQETQDEEGNDVPGYAGTEDRFGAVLAVGDFDGNGRDDLAVSIPGEKVPLFPGHDHGAVQVFYGHPSGLRVPTNPTAGSGYLQQGKLLATPGTGDRFGRSLAVGDFDADGRDDLAVGAAGESEYGTDKAGAVYVFQGSAGGLKATTGVQVFAAFAGLGHQENGYLGSDMTSGDFDGDGYADLAVSQLAWPPPTLVGILYGTANGLHPAAGVENTRMLDVDLVQFGGRLGSGDFDQDGFDELMAFGQPPLAPTESGGVVVFQGSPTGPANDFRIIQPGRDGLPGTPVGGGAFGVSLLAGDFTGDGIQDAVFGAPGDTINGVQTAGSITIVPGGLEQPALCIPGANELCLRDRFRVTLDWRTGSDSGVGRPVAQGSEDSGMFWFFEPDNWEMLVKVLDACVVNDRYWVYAAPTTDVGYTLTLRDELTGETQVYENGIGEPAQALADVDAFSSSCGVGATKSATLLRSAETGDRDASTLPETAAAATRTGRIVHSPTEDLVAGTGSVGTCVENAQTMCLGDGRFQVRVDWHTSNNSGAGQGPAKVAPVGTVDSGILWFFEEDNWEMLVKVLDACVVNDHFWVYAAAATDVGYTLRVRDTVTGRAARYDNPLGRLAPAVTDVEALPCG